MTKEQKRWLTLVMKKMGADAATDLRNYRVVERTEGLTSFDKRQIKMAEACRDNAAAWLKELDRLEGDMK